jgi:hypothetical protein
MKTTSILDLEKYYKYKAFLEDCKFKQYPEKLVLHKHHIIPKCLGGNNTSGNMISISVEDHITCHLLLAECFDENSYEHISNLRSARILNKRCIRDKDVLNKISETYVGELNPFFGKYHTEQSKEKIRESNRKRKGLTYDNIYGEHATDQKKIRSSSTKEVWYNRTQEEKNDIGKKISKKLNGKTPWNKGKGKDISVNGLMFASIGEATLHFNTSRFLLMKNFNVKIMEKI